MAPGCAAAASLAALPYAYARAASLDSQSEHVETNGGRARPVAQTRPSARLAAASALALARKNRGSCERRKRPSVRTTTPPSYATDRVFGTSASRPGHD